jgi:hypothetical protein
VGRRWRFAALAAEVKETTSTGASVRVVRERGAQKSTRASADPGR